MTRQDVFDQGWAIARAMVEAIADHAEPRTAAAAKAAQEIADTQPPVRAALLAVRVVQVLEQHDDSLASPKYDLLNALDRLHAAASTPASEYQQLGPGDPRD